MSIPHEDQQRNLWIVREETATYDAGGPAPARRKEPFSMISKEASARVRALGPYCYAVYCYLSECANQAGECWPAYLTIAHELRMSRRQVIRMITDLKDAGLLVIEPRKKATGDANSNLFRLPHFPGSEVVTDMHYPWCTPVTSAQQSPKQETVNTTPSVRQSQDSLSTPVEPVNEAHPVKPVKQDVGDFDVFWAAYPNRKKKEIARKAWAKLKPTPALVEVMVAAIEAQKQTPEWRKNGGEFIPHPSTWLNGKQWTDELTIDIDPLPTRTMSRAEQSVTAKLEAALGRKL